MEKTKVVVIATIFYGCLSCSTSGTAAVPCWGRNFPKSSSLVCVCNATYCDTVEPETSLNPGSYAVYSTSKSGSRFVETVHNFSRKLDSKHVTIRIDTAVKKQRIIGFGGTFTDASGMNIASLPDGAQQKLIDSYFAPDGIEYSLGRIPIASNDMSTDIYSYDFTQGDTGLSKFTIAGYDHLYKLPYIDEAVVASHRNVSLFGTPWSSPGWMKTNNDMVGYGTVLPEMRKVYANYLARFLREYESFMFHGRMWGLTTQSSPSRGCSNVSRPDYQSMCWTPEEMRDWIIQDLKPSLNEYGYGHIKLITVDDSRAVFPDWMKAFTDFAAWGAVDGFAVQWYNDSTVPPAVLSDAHAKFPDKFILGSEACIHETNAVELGSWERGEKMGKSVFQDMQNYVAGFTHNSLAVDMTGGPSWVKNFADSPVVVDAGKKEFYKQPMFYILGHFSKFVPPGSVVVGIIADDMPSTPAVAFLRPDGSIVVNWANMRDANVDVQILYNDHVIEFTMEARSIHSFIWDTK